MAVDPTYQLRTAVRRELAMDEAVIRAENLTKVFAAGAGRTVTAVRDATFEVRAGEIFGLLGPNGAGKTTLLRMLGTILPPTSGRCIVAGGHASESPEAIRRRVGFLSGNTRLYGRLTGREILRYFGRLYGMPEARIAARTAELTDWLGMAEFIDRRCDSLSTGQGQKVSIARVILHQPTLLILDEPTVGLDIMTSRTILEFIQAARRQGHSVIFSTHYLTEAEWLCDRIAFLYAGRILALGTTQDLCQQTGTDNLKDAFLSLVDRANGGAS